MFDDLKINLDVTKDEDSDYTILPPSKIRPKKQGRETFSNIQDLVDEFLNPDIGQLQNIIITEADEDGMHDIIAGERRWQAATKAGINLKCTVRKYDPILTFIENEGREDLTIFEKGKQLKLIQEFYNDLGEEINNNELAKKVNKDKSWVSRHLKIEAADEAFKELCKKGNITSISLADDLEKIYIKKPKIAARLVDKGVTRELLKIHLKKIKNGVDTRVREKQKQVKPILGIKEDGDIREVTFIDKDTVKDNQGNIFTIQFSDIFITGVK